MTKEHELIKELRHKTQAGFSDCKHAISQAKGDLDRAIEILRKKGVEIAAKKSARQTKDGLVGSYVHLGGKIGVLVEVNCETDFVARTDVFKNFVKDISLQIAGMDPRFLRKEDVPKEHLKDLKDDKEKKDFFKSNCLLEQPFIKDEKITINDLLTDTIAKVGENITIKRFIRYKLGAE